MELLKISLNIHPYILGSYFFSLWIWLFWIFHINGIIHFVTYCIWLLALSIMFSKFLHVVPELHFFFWLNNNSIVYILPFIYLFISWWTFGLFLIFGFYKYAAVNIHIQVFVWKHLFLLGIYLGVELLGHMVTLCLPFWGNTRLFSKAAAQFYILISSSCLGY